MSNIEQNLQKILTSRYGKDVRQSIHDSIHDCYEDGKAGSVDLVARERIANLVSMNNPTEGNSELQDIRVGFDGEVYESAGDAVRGQVGSLSDDINNGKNIDIQIYSKFGADLYEINIEKPHSSNNKVCHVPVVLSRLANYKLGKLTDDQNVKLEFDVLAYDNISDVVIFTNNEVGGVVNISKSHISMDFKVISGRFFAIRFYTKLYKNASIIFANVRLAINDEEYILDPISPDGDTLSIGTGTFKKYYPEGFNQMITDCSKNISVLNLLVDKNTVEYSSENISFERRKILGVDGKVKSRETDVWMVSDYIDIYKAAVKNMVAIANITLDGALVAFYSDKDEDSFISSIPAAYGEYLQSEWCKLTKLDVIDIPSNAKYIRIATNSFFDNTGYDKIVIEYYTSSLPSYDEAIENIMVKSSPLYNKNIIVVGDSISDNEGATKKYYVDYIVEKYCMNYQCYALSASGYSKKSIKTDATTYEKIKNNPNVVSNVGPWDVTKICDMIYNAHLNGVKADYIIMAGGTNDWGLTSYPLGSVENMETSGTIANYVYQAIQNIKQYYPLSRVLILTPLPRCDNSSQHMWNGEGEADTHTNSNGGYTLLELSDLLQEIAGYYSIDVIDMTRRSGFLFPETKEEYTKGDGLHPNETGYEIMSRKIEQKLIAL